MPANPTGSKADTAATQVSADGANEISDPLQLSPKTHFGTTSVLQSTTLAGAKTIGVNAPKKLNQRSWVLVGY